MRTNRLNEIEQYILLHETVSFVELAKHFNMSMNTMRRDIGVLLPRGKITKVYGGVAAKSVMPDQFLLSFSERSLLNNREKQIIGKLAAELVQDKSAIFLDSGTTTACMIPELAQKRDITIVTHSLIVMYEAAQYPSLNVIALGGILNHATAAFTDTSSPLLEKMHFQSVFMAASSVSPQWGAGNNTFEEFKIKEEIVNRFGKVILLVDHSKFDKVANYSFCGFGSISAIVTDRMPPKRIMEAINNNNIRIYCPETMEKAKE